MDEVVTLGRSDGPYGEVVLRRRGTGVAAVDELIVNGAFAMDSAETSTERELAALLSEDRRWECVLLGGLGLGYTAEALLRPDVTELHVVEQEPALVAWARAGITPVLARVAADPRTRLVVDDVAAVIARRTAAWDAILLDVDNGPDFLIHTENAGLYRRDGIARAVAALRPGGLLAIWCQGPAPDLARALSAFGTMHEHSYPVDRGRRSFTYVIYTLHPERAGGPGRDRIRRETG